MPYPGQIGGLLRLTQHRREQWVMGLRRKQRPTSANRELTRQLAKEELAFKRALVQARKDANLSQTQVADLLGVNKSAISRFERSDSNPTLSMIRHYAHAVGALIRFQVQPRWSARAELQYNPWEPTFINRWMDSWGAAFPERSATIKFLYADVPEHGSSSGLVTELVANSEPFALYVAPRTHAISAYSVAKSETGEK